MRPSSRLGVIILVLIVACLGVLVFAGIKSTSYSPPRKPAVTQQTLKDKLAKQQPDQKQKTGQPKASAPASKEAAPPPSQPTTPPTTQPKDLANSGPGQVTGLFILAVVLGYAIRLKSLVS